MSCVMAADAGARWPILLGCPVARFHKQTDEHTLEDCERCGIPVLLGPGARKARAMRRAGDVAMVCHRCLDVLTGIENGVDDDDE